MKYDVAIVGAGIVGLATAYELLKKQPGCKLLILEKEKTHALHQTGRNSGVIHSGIYYKPGSLKATNCRHGMQKLLHFADENAIPYRRCGKIIVATETAELPRLEALFQRGKENGIQDIKMISASEIKEIEPHAAGLKAIFCGDTAIIDYSKICAALARCIVQMGGTIQYQTELKSFKNGVLFTSAGDFEARHLVNCAGLQSDKVLRLLDPQFDEHHIMPFRGEYYSLKKEYSHLVNGLIYPVPDPQFPFLGVHFTTRMDGSVEAGPNAVLAFAREGYKTWQMNWRETLDTLKQPGTWKFAAKHWRYALDEYYRSFSKQRFVKSLQKLMPCIEAKHLEKGGLGIRAQAMNKQGALIDDFVIENREASTHVLNAPSPAATSSFAIGEHIAGLIR